MYEGEKHIPLYTDKGFKVAQFTGPQTQVIKRLKRGNKGITDVDRTSKVHDVMFSLSETPDDVRKADLRMLKNLEKIEKNKSDYWVNIQAAKRGIQAKLKGEQLGFLQEGSFSSMKGKELSDEDRAILVSNLNYMTQLGYGTRIHKGRALYNTELDELLRHSHTYIGCYSKDKIKKIPNKQTNKSFSLILNLNNSNQPGSHWTCVYHKNDSDKLEYMDSFGMKPPQSVIDLAKKLKLKIVYQDNQLQNLNSVLCGWFCREYIQFRDKNISPMSILEEFTQIPSEFNEHKVLNDDI